MSSRLYLTELSATYSPWPDFDFGQLTRLSGPIRRKFATVYDAARDPAFSGRRQLLGHLVQHAYNPDRGYYTPHTADKYLKGKLPTYSKNVRDEVPFSTILFTNPLAIPEGYGGPDFDMNACLKPSLRSTNAGWLVTTIEFDPTTIDQFEETAAWTCGKRNAPITLVDAELSKYADYRGYGAVFSGNKSVHYHFLWNTEHLINAPFDLKAHERLERMAEHAALIANAHEQYWNVVNDVVTRLLKPTLDPDKGLRSVTQYRRTPWGIRTLDKDPLLGIPAGTRVPQIVLAERIRTRAANESTGFCVPAEFSLSQPRRRRSGSSHRATGTAGAEVLKLAREWLQQWWRADYPELVEIGTEGGEAVLHFRNHAGDLNPSTVGRGDHKALLILGRGHSLRDEPYFLPDDMTAQEFYEFVLLRSGQKSPRPATGLEQPSGPVPGTFEFLKAQSRSSASPIDKVIRWPLERSFPEPLSDKPREKVLEKYRGKLADRVKWIRSFCGNLEHSNDNTKSKLRSISSTVVGGEGSSKTTAHVRSLYDEVRDQAYSWCSNEVFGAVAFRSRQQAEDKLHEFAELSPDKITPVFIQPPDAYYKSICAQLKLDPIRRTDLEDRTVHAFYSAVRERQLTVYERLEEIRKATWSESPFDGARTILTMSQRMAASWEGSVFTRAWHHPEFNPNETDEEVHRELANRFVLAKAIIDDGEIDEVICLLVSVSKLLESTESFGFKGGDLIRGGTANVDA